MITDQVINEIYKEYKKPPENKEELNIPFYVDILSRHHNLKYDDDEIIIEDLEEFNPFRRFLIRSLNAIIEFDRYIAFVFPDHILFLGKESPELNVHLKPEEEKKKSLFGKLFGG